MADLKPCPFCGGVVNWCDCGADCPQITCPHCGQFDLVKAGETLEGAKQEAETTWNNRPVEQRLDAAQARNQTYEEHIDELGDRSDTCVYSVINRVCSFCQCKRKGGER